jgi:hypothetical protein
MQSAQQTARFEDGARCQQFVLVSSSLAIRRGAGGQRSSQSETLLLMPALISVVSFCLIFASYSALAESSVAPETGPARAAELISGSRAHAPADRAKRAVGVIIEIDRSRGRLTLQSASGRTEWRWDVGTQISRGDTRLAQDKLQAGQKVRIVVETRRRGTVTKSIEILEGP